MSTNKNELNVTTAADISAAQLSLTADVVIIGSGAGGGINAYELAKTGTKVIVLGAGPYVPSEQFPEMLAASMGLRSAGRRGGTGCVGRV